MAYLIKGAHVVDPQLGLDEVLDVLVDGDKIAQVGKDLSAEAEVVDGAGKYLVPGLLDMHVHFRDPGFEYKETIETGSRAAAHGGFTDVATMPNTDPVTDTGAEIRYQLDHARQAGLCHVRPIGALTAGEKGEQLAEIGDMVMEGAAIPSRREYNRLYGLDMTRVNRMKPGAIICHPGPMNRGMEINADVADCARSRILNQVNAGVLTRMAEMYLLLGGENNGLSA